MTFLSIDIFVDFRHMSRQLYSLKTRRYPKSDAISLDQELNVNLKNPVSLGLTS